MSFGETAKSELINSDHNYQELISGIHSTINQIHESDYLGSPELIRQIDEVFDLIKTEIIQYNDKYIGDGHVMINFIGKIPIDIIRLIDEGIIKHTDDKVIKLYIQITNIFHKLINLLPHIKKPSSINMIKNHCNTFDAEGVIDKILGNETSFIVINGSNFVNSNNKHISGHDFMKDSIKNSIIDLLKKEDTK